MDRKEFILNNISIRDILNKYNIPYSKNKARCCFHGEDKHPSAYIYEDIFHCFTCGKHLDVIRIRRRIF